MLQSPRSVRILFSWYTPGARARAASVAGPGLDLLALGGHLLGAGELAEAALALGLNATGSSCSDGAQTGGSRAKGRPPGS